MSNPVFCTIFDSGFLSRGVAMARSLERWCPSARLYAFAFDDVCRDVLRELRLPGVRVVSLSEFEDPELLAVKPGRSRGEYCYTSTPAAILHVLERYGEPMCTYLDADMLFFGPPEELLAELGPDDHILLSPHNYAPWRDWSDKSGKYCVQFNPFRNSEPGLAALRWWRRQCLDWCFERYEDGKSGDQRYLEAMPGRFRGVRDLEHRGILAGWNVEAYELSDSEQRVWARSKLDGETHAVILVHYNTARLLRGRRFSVHGFRLAADARELLYVPYARALDAAAREIADVVPVSELDPHGTSATIPSARELVRFIRWKLYGEWFEAPLEELADQRDVGPGTIAVSPGLVRQ